MCLCRKTPMPTYCWTTSWWSARPSPTTSPRFPITSPLPATRCPISSSATRTAATIHLDQFRGRELLITFIYTRCPLPNFCPRVTHNFADINRQLASNPALHDKSHLLCVSFDPGQRHARAAARLWRKLYRQRCERCFSSLGFRGSRKAGTRKNGAVFRRRHHAVCRQLDHPYALHHADRSATARWCVFIPGNEWTAGPGSRRYAARRREHKAGN